MPPCLSRVPNKYRVEMMKKYLSLLLLSGCLCLSACQSAYYGAMEKVGYHKRDIMLDRVQDAKESQQDAQQEFSSALEELQSLLAIDGGNLEASYEKAKDEYESAKSAADRVSDRIERVEDVADALFEEWQAEIDEISKASLRNSSQTKLKETQRLYNTLLKSMRRAEAKMPPILTAMKDNMLYLKHNLNAQAIGAIKGEFSTLKTDIASLLKAMNKSIRDSNRFIESMSQG
jgi:Skp family chaperone for outer membrane proteins